MFPIMSLKLCHLLFNDGAALKATCRVFVKKVLWEKVLCSGFSGRQNGNVTR